MIKLGSLVKDNITELSGIAVGRIHHLHGCTHIIIMHSKMRDGKILPYEQLDEQRVEVVGVHPEYASYRERNVDTKLGSKAKHKINGFRGIIVAYREKLFGADEYMIEPTTLDKDGSIGTSYWVPLEFVEITEEQKPTVSPDASKTTQTGFNTRAMSR